MKYYKNKLNQIYAYDDNINQAILNELIAKHNLTPLSKKELETLNKPKEQDKLTSLKEQFINAIDEVLNSEAKKRGYDDIKSARSYAGYDNAFRAESEAFGKWSANVWQWGYALLERIKNGEVDINTLELSQVLKDMPKLSIESKE